jgi:hypothetical protein
MLLVLISCAVFQMIIRYSPPAFYFAFKGTISWVLLTEWLEIGLKKRCA